MLQTMLEAFNATAAWLLAAKAHLAEGKPLADIPGIEGDNDAARLKHLEERKAAHDAAKLDIDRMKAFLDADYQSSDTPGTVPPEDRRKTAPAPTEQNKAWAQAKDFRDAKVVVAKALADDSGYRDYVKAGGAGNFIKRFDDFDLVKALLVQKATLTTAGTIDVAPIYPTVAGPLEVLELCYFQNWGAEVYRRRIQARFASIAGVTAGSAFPEQSATVGATDFTLQTVAGHQPVLKRSIAAEPSVIGATAELGIADLRLELEEQVLTGNGTAPNLSGFNTQLSGTNTAAVGANTNILNHASNGLWAKVLEKRGAGGSANYILAEAEEIAKAYASLQDLASPFPATQQLPYGSPLGAGLVMANRLTDNTVIIASLGNPLYHVIPVMGGFQVEINDSVGALSDETEVIVKVYAANVVMNPNAHEEMTAANNYRVDA